MHIYTHTHTHTHTHRHTHTHTHTQAYTHTPQTHTFLNNDLVPHTRTSIHLSLKDITIGTTAQSITEPVHLMTCVCLC